jgi:lipopolysaccharide transport system permease protein
MSVGSVVSTMAAPRPVVAIEPSRGLFHLNLIDVWRHRELLYFLVWRDLKVRYKQTAIGILWVILQPLLTMAIFTIIFGYFARFPSDGVPYPLFAYVGLLPWMYFASAIVRSGLSVVGEADVIRKVYFPRLIIPMSAVVAPLVDLSIGFLIVVVMIYWYGLTLTWRFLTLPFFVLLASTAGLSVGLWLSALNVRYRDVGHTIPFLTQCWMYASPVVYPIALVDTLMPARWRFLYDLNPMVGVIAGFRWALLMKERPDFGPILASTAIVLALLGSGLVFFKRMERTFVDII